jgi:RHS repeat-associated protein
VQAVINNVTTTYVGNYYEETGGTATKYYYAGTQRVAMRVGNTLHYLFSDHLGSTSLTTDATGVKVSELRYKPWGEVRQPANGHNPGPSDYTFTGQYSHVDDFGLLFYNARWYDPALGRFAQADTIIPGAGDPQAWDRYAYVKNSPLL